MRWTPFVALLAAVTACEKPAVEWEPPRSAPVVGTDLKVDTSGRLLVGIARTTLPKPPVGPAACPAGAVVRGTYAAWWSVKPDSDAVLYSSRFDLGQRAWSRPVVVDSGDVSRSGCDRPQVSVAFAGEYVYVAYSMQASEGTGVFETHSMDRGVTFHSTVPVIYGDRVVPVSIAADTNHVVVAYEQPNGSRKEIGLSISRSQGHLFESYSTASTEVEPAFSPQVALTDSTVAVFWYVKPGCTASSCAKMMRLGHIT